MSHVFLILQKTSQIGVSKNKSALRIWKFKIPDSNWLPSIWSLHRICHKKISNFSLTNIFPGEYFQAIREKQQFCYKMLITNHRPPRECDELRIIVLWVVTHVIQLKNLIDPQKIQYMDSGGFYTETWQYKYLKILWTIHASMDYLIVVGMRKRVTRILVSIKFGIHWNMWPSVRLKYMGDEVTVILWLGNVRIYR